MAHPQHAIPIVRLEGETRSVTRAPVVERLSWALYDFSNTIRSMKVATRYFAVRRVSDLGVSNTADAIELNFGGVPTAERAVLLKLLPNVEAGRYFILSLRSSRDAAVAGPLSWGITVHGLEGTPGTAIAYRAALMTVALMSVIAAFILRGVPEPTRGTA